ncbi:hypothetical protein MH117_08530 [Paenibacillus sp. ACRRX]|uniref:hypothetical protein n=1 Tax=unclassified Paenibacillus TaxID=185978 RepID=UPI001EF64243|nr:MULTISPECIES: hypothetical protein [unclassified Paenibacillus]MCG7407466.1 hypothetical protein [Paenibacillus sp. ACRRX]MDK8180702.1 hypothetical protein [Paenibacillus sp. UMB4589-SE434]
MNEPWIYLALLGGVVAVVGLVRPTSQDSHANLKQNIEETLEHYVQEISEENEKLLQAVERLKKEADLRDEAMRRRMDMLEASVQHAGEQQRQQVSQIETLSSLVNRPQIVQTVQNKDTAEQNTFEGMTAVEAASGVEVVEDSPPTIRDRYVDLFALHMKGVKAEQIAARLNMPLGEVQLILQLSLQEDQRV